jgi:hypothetical protein
MSIPNGGGLCFKLLGPHRRTPKHRPEPGSADQTPPNLYSKRGEGGGQNPNFPAEPVAESLV